MLSLKPKRAIPYTKATKDAWWYDDKGCITIHVQSLTGEVVSCKIRRSALLGYIARSEKP